jgi:hypothetical protein
LEAGSVPPSLNFPQLDFVEPSSGFHPVTWERVNKEGNNIKLLPYFFFISSSLVISLQKIVNCSSELTINMIWSFFEMFKVIIA